jgi:triphosphatase
MVETELKFQIPAGRSAALARAVATPLAQRQRLQAAYFDTADRRLAAAGLALRLRREGRRWVQTLKGRGDGLMARAEHEVPVAGGSALPRLEPSRHAGTPVGDSLIALLADGAALHVVYRTDVMRTRRSVASGGARIEIAHDRGHIEAGSGARVAVDEIEFELLSGPPVALLELAHRWADRHGLWWDVRTKSERGFRLAEGLHTVPAVHAQAVQVDGNASAPAALAALIGNTMQQVLPNAAELAGGSGEPAHLHQLRVGLRRLRTVLREAAPWAGSEAEAVQALEREWAAPFGALGTARDADVLAQGAWAELASALAAAALPPLPAPALGAAGAAADAGATVRGTAMQQLLLRTQALVLLMAAAPPAGEGGPPAPADTTALLQPLFKKVRRDARAMATLDLDGLHRVRKRAKRLRYLLEALAPSLKRKALARLLKGLKRALARFGELNDLHTAELALPAPEAGGAHEGSRCYALGHLRARQAALRPLAQQALLAALELPRPWR